MALRVKVSMAARNVELKAVTRDLERCRSIAGRLSCKPPVVVEQVDTYFYAVMGHLKLREQGDGSAELITYSRPDHPDKKLSQYTRVAIEDPSIVKTALSDALGQRVVVKKRREVFLRGMDRIHLDEVHELGTFIEFEAVLGDHEPLSSGEQRVESLKKQFEISHDAVIYGSYADLVLAGRRKVGGDSDAGGRGARCVDAPVMIRRFAVGDQGSVIAVARTLPLWFTSRGLRQLATDLQHQEGLVALRDGRVVGFLSYYVVEGEAHIAWMGVVKGEHRQGIGRLVVEQLVAMLRSWHIESILVDTLGSSVDYEPYALTRAFYRGIGFKEHACIKQDDPEWPERLTLRLAIPVSTNEPAKA